MINPHILPPDILDCPRGCPFLGMRSFMPNTIPFYCNQYDTFLGGSPLHTVRRCSDCRGEPNNIVETGLSFIDSYTVDHYRIEETKRAFLKLEHSFQRMFVDLVSRTGVQIVLEPGEEDNPDALSDKILLKRQDMKDKYGSPEAQEFKGILDADGMPLMSRQTKTLLMNLFLVMDNSEKEMMKDILQNPKQIESFLNSFQKQPQDQDLLKNVRALIYDYDRRRQMELGRERARHLNQTRVRQMELERQKQNETAIRQALRNRQKERMHSR